MHYQIFQHIYEKKDGTIAAYNTIKVNSRWISSGVNKEGKLTAVHYNQSVEDLNKMLQSIDPNAEVEMGDWKTKKGRGHEGIV
jgi:hypothetical protein